MEQSKVSFRTGGFW